MNFLLLLFLFSFPISIQSQHIGSKAEEFILSADPVKPANNTKHEDKIIAEKNDKSKENFPNHNTSKARKGAVLPQLNITEMNNATAIKGDTTKLNFNSLTLSTGTISGAEEIHDSEIISLNNATELNESKAENSETISSTKTATNSNNSTIELNNENSSMAGDISQQATKLNSSKQVSNGNNAEEMVLIKTSVTSPPIASIKTTKFPKGTTKAGIQTEVAPKSAKNIEIDTSTESSENSDEAMNVPVVIASSSQKSNPIGPTFPPNVADNFTTKHTKLRPVKVTNGAVDKDDKLVVKLNTETSDQSRGSLVISLSLISIALCSVLGFVVYRRVRSRWSRRNYERVDFLIDGMYHDL